MFKNYITVALRNFRKFKVVSLINIIGLSISLSIVIIIASYAEMELSTNRLHKNYDNIYKIGKGATPAPVADVIKADIPEIKATARIMNTSVTMKYADHDPVTLKNLIFADADFFGIFSFSAVKGNMKTALTDPMSMVITETEAKRIFGDEYPINKTIKMDNEFELTIKAVIKDIPQNSSMKFGAAASFSSLKIVRGNPHFDPFDWRYSDYETYFLATKNTNPVDLSKKVKSVMDKKLPAYLKELNVEIFPFKDIYHNPELSGFSTHNGVENVFILISIAIIIMIIAVINFINLSTARASMRTKEIGIRKTIGASRFLLIKQFLSESLIVSIISTAIAVLLASEFALLFNQLTDVRLSIFSGIVFNRIIIYLSGALLLGILAGIYPAFYLSSFKPEFILKGKILQEQGNSYLRKILIVFQFSAAIVLIVSTFVIYNQLEYLKNKPLGFQKDNIIYVKTNIEIFFNKEVFKNKLLQIPGINDFAYSFILPGEMPLEWKHNLRYEGNITKTLFAVAPTSNEYMRLMGMKIKDGRSFFENSKDDDMNAIVNEEFVKKYGLKEPFKAEFEGMPGIHKIVGVVKDFNFKSLHSQVEPLVFVNSPDWFTYGVIKLGAVKYGETKRVIKQLNAIWKEVSPDFPFEYKFLNENLDLQYKSDERFEKTIICFAVLAIIISCLGLFGLTSFTTEQRIKEIGIRKILGASTPGITAMLSKQFIMLVIAAITIACPLAYYFMNKWLLNFAYRIEISWWMFALSGSIAIVIAIATVSFQAVKAATANPVESLKYE